MVPSNGIGKERSDVYSLSHLYVAAHQNEMLNLAANERLARPQTTSESRVSIGSALKNVWSFLSGPAERPLNIPTLTNYPYRG
jgi:hypothetical protein